MAMKHFQENQPNEGGRKDGGGGGGGGRRGRGGRGEGEKEGRFPGMVSAEDETEGK